MKLVSFILLISALQISAHDWDFHRVTRSAKSNETLNQERLRTRSKKLRQFGPIPPAAGYMQDFSCTECLTDKHFRILYMDSVYASENPQAGLMAARDGTNYPCGACCGDPVLAHPECFVAANWNKGWVAAPVRQILKTLGAQVTTLTTANFSAETEEPSGGSLWARCIWEVYFGNVDLCVGDYWETSERRALVGFTTPIDINHFILVTRARSVDEFRLFSMTDPFKLEVWSIMFLIFIVTAVMMWIVQSEDAVTDFEDDEVFPRIRGLGKSIWMAFMGYLSAHDPKYITTSWAGRWIILGYGFFLFISVMSYTANLASFMVLQKKQEPIFSTLQQIVDGQKKMCVTTDMQNMITQEGLGLDLRIQNNHAGPMLERLLRDDCQAAVLGKHEYAMFISGSNANYIYCNDTADDNYMMGWFCFKAESQLGIVDLAECKCMEEGHLTCPPDLRDCSDIYKFCNMMRMSDPDFEASVSVSMPASSRIEPYISAWLVQMRQTGEMSSYIDNEFYANNPDRCPGNTAEGSLVQEKTATSLDLNAMAGTYMVSCSIIVIGFIVYLYEFWELKKEQAEAEEEVPEDLTAINEHQDVPSPSLGPSGVQIDEEDEDDWHEADRKKSTITGLPAFRRKPPGGEGFGDSFATKGRKGLRGQGGLARAQSVRPSGSITRATSIRSGNVTRASSIRNATSIQFAASRNEFGGSRSNFGSSGIFGQSMRAGSSWRTASNSFIHRQSQLVDAEIDSTKTEILDIRHEMSDLKHEVGSLLGVVKGRRLDPLEGTKLEPSQVKLNAAFTYASD